MRAAAILLFCGPQKFIFTMENAVKHLRYWREQAFWFERAKRSHSRSITDVIHGFRGIGRMKDWDAFLVFIEYQFCL
jgi:hypothetical protein